MTYDEVGSTYRMPLINTLENDDPPNPKTWSICCGWADAVITKFEPEK
jgi:hypothetical protein